MTTREHTAALTADFHALNTKYFGGRLPTRRVRYGKPPGTPDALGQYDRVDQCIWIAPGQKGPEEERRTLLHEMCHVAEGDSVSAGATSEFFAALCALANQGEPWAIDDAVCELLNEMVQADSTRPWREVRKGVAFILGWPPKRVDAACPTGSEQWAYYCAREAARGTDKVKITCVWRRGSRAFVIGRG